MQNKHDDCMKKLELEFNLEKSFHCSLPSAAMLLIHIYIGGSTYTKRPLAGMNTFRFSRVILLLLLVLKVSQGFSSVSTPSDLVLHGYEHCHFTTRTRKYDL